jgi:hypothetical protein
MYAHIFNRSRLKEALRKIKEADLRLVIMVEYKAVFEI